MFSSLTSVKRIIFSYFLWLTFLALLATGCMLAVIYHLNKPFNLSEPQPYILVEGSNLTRVSHDLANKGLLQWPIIFKGYARFFELSAIKAGEYEIRSDDTPLSLLNKFINGEVIYYQVTFPEGWSVKQWLDHLKKQSKLKHTEAIDLSFIEGYPEGWLYPDTYRFQSGSTDLALLKNAYKKMTAVLMVQWQSRATDLPYKTPYEALIMASIVEKETGAAFERPEIAGVFIRRLNKRMKLQTDPTVIYGMGDSYKGNITRRNLRQDTPYNTYVHRGLPPTPIANPGEAAIYAALHPADGKALYFVAKGDGSHYFSATLAEHEAAVQKYQRSRRKKKYRSSPAK